MGIFSAIGQFVSGSHDQSRGIYIINEIQGTYNAMKRMDRCVANEILARYRHKRTHLLNEISTKYWTFESSLKVAKQIQLDAKNQHGTDLTEAYSLWLTGAWLESTVRDSEAARDALEILNDIATYTDISDL